MPDERHYAVTATKDGEPYAVKSPWGPPALWRSTLTSYGDGHDERADAWVAGQRAIAAELGLELSWTLDGAPWSPDDGT